MKQHGEILSANISCTDLIIHEFLAPIIIFTQLKCLISGVEQERDFFMLLLEEGSTGAELKEFLGGEGQKELAPEEMEHIQVFK